MSRRVSRLDVPAPVNIYMQHIDTERDTDREKEKHTERHTQRETQREGHAHTEEGGGGGVE